MQLEEEIFKQYHYVEAKLLAYGFHKRNNNFYYETSLASKNFQVQITITKQNKVKGKIIDLDINEEYLPVHSNQRGKFVDEIRNEYRKLLQKIRQQCFTQVTIYPEEPQHYWLIPANPKYFDIISAFKQVDNLTWKQSTKIQPNDIVFIYVGAPISAILYQCQVLEVNIPHYEHDEFLTITHVMRLKKLVTYPREEFTFKKLASYNVKAVRGPRHVPEKLLQNLLKKHK